MNAPGIKEGDENLSNLLKRCRVPVAAMVLAFATAASAQGGPPPAPVRVAMAGLHTMAPVLVVPATVVSRDDARIAAEVSGMLIRVADVGQRFAAGEIVAEVENTALQLRRPELEAEIAQQEARVEFLRSEEARLAKLATQNNAARNSLEQTRADRLVAENEARAAQARLAQLDFQLERTRIKAPFDGTVVARLSQAGELVAPGTVVVRMVNPNRLELIARAPLDYLPYLQVGDPVEFGVAARSYRGPVRTLVAVGDENTHLFEVRVDVSDSSLPVGQTARLSVPASSAREVLAVPRDALVLRPEGISVFVIDDQMTAAQVRVTTGLASGALIEVVGAVEPGDRVVVRGNERLRPGQVVTIQEPPGNPPSATAGQ